MVERFVKIPLSNDFKPDLGKIHYVWLNANSITRIEYKNSDIEQGIQLSRIYYIEKREEGDHEIWYQSSCITPEHVVAALNSDNIDASSMLDNELSNTLLQTQLLLKETISSQRMKKAKKLRCQLDEAYRVYKEHAKYAAVQLNRRMVQCQP